MAFNFSRLNSLMQSVQSTIKTVESSIDRAIGAEETLDAAAPLTEQQQHERAASVSDDFFSAFGDGFAPAVAIATTSKQPVCTATTPSQTSSQSSTPPKLMPSGSGWDLNALSSAASNFGKLTHSMLLDSKEPSHETVTPHTTVTLPEPLAPSLATAIAAVVATPVKLTPSKKAKLAVATIQESTPPSKPTSPAVHPIATRLPPAAYLSETKSETGGDSAQEASSETKSMNGKEEHGTEDWGEGWGHDDSADADHRNDNAASSEHAQLTPAVLADEEVKETVIASELEQPHSSNLEHLGAESEQSLPQSQSPSLTYETAAHQHPEMEPLQSSTRSQPQSSEPEQRDATVESSNFDGAHTHSQHEHEQPSEQKQSTAVKTTEPEPSNTAAAPSAQPAENALHAIEHATSQPSIAIDTSTPPALPPAPATPMKVTSSLPATPSAASPSNITALNSTFDFSLLPDDVTAKVNDLIKRCEESELITKKLNRLVKVRELQLEKVGLEKAQLYNEYQSLKSTLEPQVQSLTQSVIDERKRVAVLTEERDVLRRVKDHSESSLEAVKAKDSQIEAVMKEGQQLMQKQANLEQLIKKLRKEVSEKDAVIEQHSRENQTKNQSIAALNETLAKEKEKARSMDETVASLTHSIEESSSRITELTQQLRMLETAASESQLELLRVQEENGKKSERILVLTDELSTLSRDRSEVHQQIQHLKHDTQSQSQREESLMRSINDLQSQLSRNEEIYQHRINGYEADIRAIREQLQATEQRNEELATAVPQATRPLLRQIDALRQSMAEQSEEFQTTEHSLKARIKELELSIIKTRTERAQLEESKHRVDLEILELSEKNKQWREKLNESECLVKSLRNQFQSQHDNHSLYAEQLHAYQSKCEELETDKQQLERKLHRVTEDKQVLEQQVASVSKRESETKARLESQLAELTVTGRSAQLSMMQQPPPTPSNYQSQPSTPAESASASISGLSHSSSSSSLSFASPSNSAQPAAFEYLRSLLRQRESELVTLKDEMRSLERTRGSLTEQCVELRRQVNAGQASQQRLASVDSQLSSMSLRYDAALQLIGEKEDELEELHADMSQVKAMFRAQIEQLIKQIEQLKGGQSMTSATNGKSHGSRSSVG